MSFSVSRKNSLYVEPDQYDAPRTLAIRDRPWKTVDECPTLISHTFRVDCDLFVLLRCFLDTGRLSVSRLEESDLKPLKSNQDDLSGFPHVYLRGGEWLEHWYSGPVDVCDYHLGGGEGGGCSGSALLRDPSASVAVFGLDGLLSVQEDG